MSALLAILMSISACGVGRAGVTTPSDRTSGVAIHPGIVARSASVQVPSEAPRTEASASCQAGEALIGGGYTSSDTFEYAAIIVASYPASATTWTVAAAASPAFILRAEAYCVPAGAGLGPQIVQAPIDPTRAASCPAGSVLLSGGFQASGPVVASRPDGNGWYAAMPSLSAGTVYALCASQHARAGSDVVASLDPHSSSRGQRPDGATLPCPASPIATAGGFRGGGLVITSATAGAPYEGWSVIVGGDGDLTLYAHCVALTV
ncbi:MAG TPA: hypothetical protein VFQ25_04580 [Ktedonobacterales bacterium]|nr:hypothetical protein [Ktedonobacterales bacterium]